MPRFLLSIGFSAAAALLAIAPAHADTSSVNFVNDPRLIQVADGCGANGWRGRWGHCHYYGGGWGAQPYGFPPHPYWGGGCGPGRWRGPHGHCRVY